MKRSLKLDLTRYAPVGQDVDYRKQILTTLLIYAGLLSVMFFALAYGNGLEYPNEMTIAPAFSRLALSPLAFFDLIPLIVLLQVPFNYAYHRRNGSKSYYLMRRLPDRWEYHRRCWGLSILGIILTQLVQWGFALAYFAFYMLATPDRLIPPDSWRSLLEVLL